MRFFLLGILILLVPQIMAAQDVADKIQWKTSIEKTEKQNEFRITATASLQPGWHVFGQKPGDDFLIPFNFTLKNKDVKIVQIDELGILKTENMEGVGTIHYYEKEVSFVATIRTIQSEINGAIEFQVCNEKMCLPPTEEIFTLNIK